MKHYNSITREFDGVVCRLAATTQSAGFRGDIVERLKRGVYEHVHVHVNPEPTSKMNTYMIFVGGKQHEANRTHTVFGIEVHNRTCQHV